MKPGSSEDTSELCSRCLIVDDKYPGRCCSRSGLRGFPGLLGLESSTDLVELWSVRLFDTLWSLEACKKHRLDR